MTLRGPDIELLRRVGLFSQLPEDALGDIAAALEGVQLAAATEVFTKGSPGDCLYIVAAGRVVVHDEERLLEELGAGEVFGEMALIDEQPRSASVATLEPCLLFRVDQASFYRLLADRPEVARAVIRVLSRRLRARLRDIADDKRYIAQLYQASRERDRLSSELHLAAKLQAGFLPEQLPSLDGWQLSASWQPAREMSGDFYDVIGDEAGAAADVVIADVADKGMSAALFMALTRSALRSSLSGGLAPARGVAAANRLLCADASDGMFVTLFLARLSDTGGEVSYVNAGHNPPLLFEVASGACSRLTRTGLLVGWDENASFEQATVTLACGDVLLLYTDGVTEALDPEGLAYGEERLEALLRATSPAAPDEIVAALKRDLDRFCRGVPPHDDMTVVAIRRG